MVILGSLLLVGIGLVVGACSLLVSLGKTLRAFT